MSDMDDEKKASIVYALPFSKKAEDVPGNCGVPCTIPTTKGASHGIEILYRSLRLRQKLSFI